MRILRLNKRGITYLRLSHKQQSRESSPSLSGALKFFAFHSILTPHPPVVVLEKTLESALDSKEIKQVNAKGNPPWRFIGRTGAEAPILLATWCKELERTIIGKNPDAEKDWRQEKKKAAENEMVRYHPWLKRHELEQSGRQWRIGEPGMLQSMGSQRVRQLRGWTTTPSPNGCEERIMSPCKFNSFPFNLLLFFIASMCVCVLACTEIECMP